MDDFKFWTISLFCILAHALGIMAIVYVGWKKYIAMYYTFRKAIK